MTEFLKKNSGKVLCCLICLAVIMLICFAGINFISQQIKDTEIEKVLSVNGKNDTIEVYVDGEVINKGTYILRKGANVGDAIEAAGGFTKEANRKINVAIPLKNGSCVTVVDKSQNANSGIDFRININTADEGELMLLSGIGKKTAENIVKYREENGNFCSPGDIMKVKGIGTKLYNNIKDAIVTE